MNNFATVDSALSAWSIFIQLMINIPLFLMFLISWFTAKRKVFVTWSIAWAINLIALVMVLLAANWEMSSYYETRVFFYSMYASAKIIFAVLLYLSAIQFSRRNEAINIPIIFLFSLALLFFMFFLAIDFHPVIIQFIVYGLVCLLFYSSVYVCVKTSLIECKVVAFGFFVQGTMFLHHFIILTLWFTKERVPVYMSRISFFDTISEFVLALTFFLGVIIRVINEYREMNIKLEQNQENLRTLVDIDPLTGLKNRRVLRSFFNSIKGQSGCIAFIDVNKFKQINDNWGHTVGDKCLTAIAIKMKEVFRFEDGLFRLGGDEFLIVCPEISKMEMINRLDKFKKEIKHFVKGVSLTVAVGVDTFEKDSHLDQVLKRADKEMYKNKKSV
ncbi:GGDEF domain-containing protein [Thermotomaculum hydrothermale]|nr:GGDEF domain-containing protein [Thermotomaculum hydrothermale]